MVPNEKSYVFNEQRFPGGNGVNAARIAHRLGSKVFATGFLGGASGKEYSELLTREKIPQKFLFIKDRTRTNITISLDKGHKQTRLSFPGPKIRNEEKKEMLSALQSMSPSLVLLGGSLPENLSPAFINKVIGVFHARQVPVFVDVPGHILKKVLSKGPYFIKPNLTEFQEMTGTRYETIKDVLLEAKKYSVNVPLQCISSVEGGALFVTPHGTWFGKLPRIEICSTVGAGDSMVGAMAHTLVKNIFSLDADSCEKAFRFGLAAAAATLSNPGLTMGTKSSIQKFVPRIIIKRVQ